MQIRNMTVGDYADVHRLWSNTTGMGLNNVDESEQGIARFLERNPQTCFVALDGGAVIGVILCGHDGRRGYIYHTAVAAERRKCGIGRALLERALQALEAEHISKVALVAFAHNEIGNAFWQAQGFTERTDLVYRNKALIELERLDT